MTQRMDGDGADRPPAGGATRLLLQLTAREERARDAVVGVFLRVIPPGVTPLHLTQLRMVLVGAAVALLAFGASLRQALVLFGAAALTDFVDGPLARRRGLTSPEGARLDQVADVFLGATLGVTGIGWGVVDRYLALALVLPQALFFGVTMLYRLSLTERPTTPARLQFALVILGFWLALWGVGSNSPALARLGRGLLWAEALLSAGVAVLRVGRWYPERHPAASTKGVIR